MSRKNKSRRIVGICVLCRPWAQRVLTRHHVYPKRWYNDTPAVLLLCCARCHEAIEKQIHEEEVLHHGQLPKERYAEIAVDFVQNHGTVHIGF